MKDAPCWEPCELCDEYICNIHGGEHVHNCECEDLEWWAERDMYPYETTVLQYLVQVCEVYDETQLPPVEDWT